jgi:DNA-binding NarL/FixJ family response regulator
VLPSARPVDLRAAVVAGAAGVVEERSAEVALVATLGAALAGQLVLPSTARTAVAPPPLSRREKQVLGLVVLGLSNADIASRLHVTEATVKSHLTAGFRKLGVRTRSAAAARILDPREGLGIGILSLTEPDATLNVLTEA